MKAVQDVIKQEDENEKRVKERLNRGYILSMLMPLIVVIVSSYFMSGLSQAIMHDLRWIGMLALILVFHAFGFVFTLRCGGYYTITKRKNFKTFRPLQLFHGVKIFSKLFPFIVSSIIIFIVYVNDFQLFLIPTQRLNIIIIFAIAIIYAYLYLFPYYNEHPFITTLFSILLVSFWIMFHGIIGNGFYYFITSEQIAWCWWY